MIRATGLCKLCFDFSVLSIPLPHSFGFLDSGGLVWGLAVSFMHALHVCEATLHMCICWLLRAPSPWMWLLSPFEGGSPCGRIALGFPVQGFGHVVFMNLFFLFPGPEVKACVPPSLLPVWGCHPLACTQSVPAIIMFVRGMRLLFMSLNDRILMIHSNLNSLLLYIIPLQTCPFSSVS